MIRSFLPEAVGPLLFEVGPNGTLPSRTHPSDAGFDLYVAEDRYLYAGEFSDIPTDVKVELPDGVWAMITGRSSTWRTRGLVVIQGVIDTGWRGELFTAVQNAGKHAVEIKAGERLAQFIPMFNVSAHFEAVSVPWVQPHRDRGVAGFGSSGR